MSRWYQLSNLRIALSWLGVLWLLVASAVAAYDYGGILPVTQWWLTLSGLPLALLQMPFAYRELTTNRKALWFLAILTFAVLACHLYRMHVPHWIAWPVTPGVQSIRHDFVIPSQIPIADRSIAIGLTPHLTANAISVWSLGVMAAFIAAFSLHSRQTIVIWLVGFSIIAATLSFYGIATSLDRQLLPSGYRHSELAPGGQPFATFVNRNNAAGVLCLGICAVIGLTVLKIRAISRANARGVWYPGAASKFGQISRYASDPGFVALSALFLLIAAGTMVSGSRGGFVTLLITCIATVLKFSGERRWLTIALVLVCGIGTVVLVQWLGIHNTVVSRFESLIDDQASGGDSPNSRLTHWLDGLRAVAFYMLLGSGLGTYRYAYLPMQQYSFGAWYMNADNLWLELLVETGFAGLIVIVSLFGILLATSREMTSKRVTFRTLLGALGFSLTVTLLCSQFFDFGLLLPAMMIPAAALAMSAISYSQYGQQSQAQSASLLLGGGEKRFYGARVHGLGHQSVRTAKMLVRSPKSIPSVFSRSKFLRSFQNFWHGLKIRQQIAWALRYITRRPAIRNLIGVQWARPLSVAVSVIVVGQAIWSLGTLYDASVVMALDYKLRDWDYGQIASRKVLDELESEIPAQLERSPHHPELLRLSAEISLLSLRADLTAQILEISPELGPQRAWERSALSNIRTYLTRDKNAKLTDLLSPQQIALLKTSRGELLTALDDNPLDDLLRFRLLQSDFIAPDDRAPLVAQYLRIRPRDEMSLWKLATLVSPEGNGQAVAPIVRQLLTEHPHRLSSVIQWLGEDRRLLNSSPLSDWIPENRPDLLVEAIRQRKADLAPEQLQAAYDQAKGWLQDNPLLPTTVHRFTSARLAMLQEQWQDAMKYWQEAVQLQPQRIDWKIEQLQCVVATGQPRLALEMAREYAHQHPRDPLLQKQLDELQKSIVQ